MLCVAYACNNNQSSDPYTTSAAPLHKAVYYLDKHSYANIDKARCKDLYLDIEINFDNKTISGTATYNVIIENADTMIFDSKALNITKIEVNGKESPYRMGKSDELLGTPVYVPVTNQTQTISITYSTTQGSEALQWLSPAQTAGKTHPYLLTQGEAILTRSWIPIQDSPGNRITYKARVKTPKDIMVVMSASNPTEKNPEGVYHFEMNQPIPAYLIALAAGNIEFRPLGKRTGVYTEPEMIEKCVYELAETEKMLEVVEGLYGPYLWERYDIIVLPPSFPFGGMENPRLTFATPTIIAGDRSLTSLIAHEMAHSWSGNLVTNATWNDFWLNEGFTVYIERRIMEALYGREYAEMLSELGKQELYEEVQGLKEVQPDDTKLKLNLDERNPDEGMTQIAYEKGAFFLRMLEEKAGRDKFDAFLKSWFEKNKFKTVVTEDFVEFLNKELIEKYNLTGVNTDEWVYGREVPANISVIQSNNFKKVEEALEKWKSGTPAKSLETANWSTHEWLHFLRHLPAELKHNQLIELDQAFGFTKSGNAEISCQWLQIGIQNKYKPALDKTEDFLLSVGRRKFVKPLFEALAKTPEGKKLAIDIYKKARPGYHFVTYSSIDKILGWE
jgi:leukotriene A-4 hydrolase/aminopeptidase